jgi:hypothetical protein
MVMSGIPRIESLTLYETDLVNQMELDYEGLCRNLGGIPFAIICTPGRQRRYKRLAEMLGLQIFANPEVRRSDGFLLIHQGEVARWLPGYKVPSFDGVKND